MKDIRPKAEERARQRAAQALRQAPRQDGAFQSERTRAREALRSEVNTYTGENVRKIAATAGAVQEDRVLRVAAYCRVSTDDIDQLVSIELQKNNYRDMIRANPKWKYVGTYVDDGFSGTNTDHRPAFQLMMKDAMAGRIEKTPRTLIQTNDTFGPVSKVSFFPKSFILPVLTHTSEHQPADAGLFVSCERIIFGVVFASALDFSGEKSD